MHVKQITTKDTHNSIFILDLEEYKINKIRNIMKLNFDNSLLQKIFFWASIKSVKFPKPHKDCIFPDLLISYCAGP